MLLTCVWHACSMQVICWQPASNMLVTCWQHAGNMLATCWQHAGNNKAFFRVQRLLLWKLEVLSKTVLCPLSSSVLCLPLLGLTRSAARSYPRSKTFETYFLKCIQTCYLKVGWQQNHFLQLTIFDWVEIHGSFVVNKLSGKYFSAVWSLNPYLQV